jgi:hypothetical protein
MFQLLKTLAVVIGFAVPVIAQWGTVVAQPDTNRFINSTQTYGLVMPHQDVIIGKLDTTITSVGIQGGNGSKVIVGSLLNYDDNCVGGKIVNGEWDCSGSYEAWREKEKSTSWYQAARGDTSKQFPTDYMITSSTGGDSSVVWNLNTGELWMAFKASAGPANMMSTTNGLRGQQFKDGILYFTDAEGNGFCRVDFLSDIGHQINTASRFTYNGNIQQRNDGLNHLVNMSGGIVSNTVTSVDVVRDPFGLQDVNGAPKHWWIVSHSTNLNTGLYNPHTNAIYDGTATSADIYNVSFNRRGVGIIATNNSGSEDYYEPWQNMFTISADGMTNTGLSFSPAQTGVLDMAWPSTPIGGRALQTNQLSILGENANKAFLYSTQGLYALHLNGPRLWPTGAKQRFSSTVNAPVEFGDAVLNFAAEDGDTDSSPYNLSLVETGAFGEVAAVFGNGISTGAGVYASITGNANIAGIGGTDASISLWVKTALAQPASTVNILTAGNAGGNPELRIFMRSDGTIDAIYNNGSASDLVTNSLDMTDGNWHHVAFVRNVTSNIQTLYIDGVVIATDASLVAAGASTNDDLYINAGSTGNNNASQLIYDEIVLSKSAISAEAIAKIHAEGRKKLNMGTPVFTSAPDDALLSNAVIAVDALDNGIWAVAFSDANTVQVFDGRIPIQQIAAPSGTVKDIALIQNAGSDSVGVAIVTTTNLKIVQPDVSLEKMALSQLYHNKPILITSPVVVDSSGVDGIFWTADDAIAAGKNSGRDKVFVLHGTYGPFDMNQNGMWLQCESARISMANATGVLFNGNATDNALDISAGEVSNCGFYTAPSGGGGGYGAINGSGGSWWRFHDNFVIDSDANGITIASSNIFVYGNNVSGADGECIATSGNADSNVINDNYTNNCGSNGIVINSNGDNNVVIGNISDQPITDTVGTSTLSNEVY